MFIVVLDENNIATAKGINYIGTLFSNEIEITEEQFNQMVDFPLKLTIKDGQVIAWEKTIIEYEPIPEQPKEPTQEERIQAVEEAINFLLGL